MRFSCKRGFTLLEVLLVVAIIAILAGIVILAINPIKQLGDSHNAQRRTDVATIVSAVYQYSIDNNGSLPATLTSQTPTEICRTGASSCTGLVDLVVLTESARYVVAMPVDPVATSTNGTGYLISRTANNRITVSAPYAEIGATISVTK